MKFPVQRIGGFLGAVCLALSLSACVTNEEQGHPEGWEEITPKPVPSIEALVPQDIRERGVLTAGTNPPFAPFEFRDSSHAIIGVEMDLMHAAAATMGLQFQPKEQDFSLILPSLSAGSVDVGASGFTDTEERRENYDFIDFLYAGVQWGQQTGDDISREDPCGLSIAVQRTTVSETDDVRPLSEQCVEEGKDPIEVLSYDTSDAAATALVLGRADAFSADSPVLAWAVERADGKIEPTGEIFDAAPYGFAVPKDSKLGPALAAALQYLIDNGDYQKILAQWGIEDGLVDEALINEEPVNN
ncbi:ABC transporter substrate-binding protein [Corynebacterium pseudopelargi]|uniref:Glutamine-binding periplasmic protein n=1 Tax=Corynebacterium pseudopelargi TaxID=2080757 RepID=A0A3G6IUS8_9CORY|nr:ABC transporter substrate-binding protein [Corynebacterium pseudopelargi]AZA09393.1 Glutamine-binding periplasmic protein precursor [Corynebacterium pseudopelargi]